MPKYLGLKQDGTTVLEIGAEKCTYPVNIEQGGSVFVAPFTFMAPQVGDIVKLLTETQPEFSQAGKGRMIIESTRREPYCDLFDKVFVEMGGIEGNPSVEAQKNWLDRNPKVKVKAIMQGLGGAEINPESGVVAEQKGLRLSDMAENAVRVLVRVWDDEAINPVEILTVHHLRAETREDEAAYRRATGRIENRTRSQQWKPLVDYSALVRMYDLMAGYVEGAFINGQPCGPENRENWLPHIPAWHKVAIVQEVMSGDAKNG